MLITLFMLTACNGVTLHVEPAYAPNAFGSPSWEEYTTNAMNGLRGFSTETDRTTNPAAYETISDGSEIHPREVVVTGGFRSWRGIANPGEPFDRELGNRVHFGFRAFTPRGADEFFSLDDITWERLWQNADDGTESYMVLDPTIAGGFVGQEYSDTRIGIIYAGGKDDADLFIGEGTAADVPVNEVILLGLGDGLVGSALFPELFPQDQINATLDLFGTGPPQRLLARYSLDGQSIESFVDLTQSANAIPSSPVPEASTIALALIAILVLRVRR